MTKLVGGVLAAVLGLVGLSGCGNSVDEDAWRGALESEWGTQMSEKDWAAWRDGAYEICDKDAADFQRYVISDLHDGINTVDLLQTDLTYACPDRMEQLDEILREVGQR